MVLLRCEVSEKGFLAAAARGAQKQRLMCDRMLSVQLSVQQRLSLDTAALVGLSRPVHDSFTGAAQLVHDRTA